MPPTAGTTVSSPVLAVSALLVAYFAAAAVPWAVRAFSSERNLAGAAAGHAAMSSGMAAMLLVMLLS